MQEIRVEERAGRAPMGIAEVAGVGAGAFDPAHWEKGTLHWLPDVRSPLLEPREGRFRNIYAPSAVETPEGWRVFYGAWDGVPTGNDRIYSVTATADFLDFQQRHTVIEHSGFVHVCNVNALRLPDGAYRMVCTVYPDKNGKNKPAFFHSPDGKVWNGAREPYPASEKDIVTIEGYPDYPRADINGMNVLLHEHGVYCLYFGDFSDFGQVRRASGKDGRTYRYEGAVLEGRYAVNDVKKFRVGGGQAWYLMGLHLNGDTLWYSLSRGDGMRFPPARTLGRSLSPAERYMVALGWVVQGGQEAAGRKVLGFLYGAGHDPGLASNRIFARWLQKRLVFVADAGGARFEGNKARGPERQWIGLDVSAPAAGKLEVYAEDGVTLLGVSPSLVLRPGRVYAVHLPDSRSAPLR